MDELKPCPFCGGKAFLSSVRHEERVFYPWYARAMCIRCQASCGPTGFSESEAEANDKALKAWNRRANNAC